MNSTSDSVTTFSSPNFIEISPLKQLMAVVTGYYSTLFFVTFVSADEANTIHLKCNIATSSSPCSVLDHQVPVFICNKDALSSSAWDVTTQQVSNFDILTCIYTCLLQHLSTSLMLVGLKLQSQAYSHLWTSFSCLALRWKIWANKVLTVTFSKICTLTWTSARKQKST